MANVSLHERSREVLSAFNDLYGKLKLEQSGELDMAAHLIPVMEKLSASIVAKYSKEKHPDFPQFGADAVHLTDAYILSLNFAAVFDLIIDNKKIIAKRGLTPSGLIMDIINTLSKMGKANAAVSDHYLISSALNQIVIYADRYDYEIEDIYQLKLAQAQSGAKIAKAS